MISAQKMANNNPTECSVCLVMYNETHRRPRSLPCGHSFCSLCVTDMIKNGNLTCPSCRATHKATTTSDIPICYGMEELIRVLNINRSTSPVPGEDIDENLRSLLKKEEYNMTYTDELCDCLLGQLGSYESLLVQWQNDHQELTAGLNELLNQNKDLSKLLNNEQKSVEALKKDVEQRRKQRHAMKECLALVTNFQEAVAAIQESDACKRETENFVWRSQELHPDVDSLYKSLWMREATRRAMGVVAADTRSGGVVPVQLGIDSHPTIMDKINHIIMLSKINRTTSVSVEELRPLTGPLKTLVEAGWVVAVQRHQGHLRCSRITLQDSQLHVHTLLNQFIPANARTVEHSDVMGLVDPSSTLVFLDLGWGGTTKGRVYIRLSPDTGLARQFLLLCTGERGPTYAGTRMLGAYNKGKPGERVCGGDHHHTGEGGARLLPGLQVGPEYRKTPTAGTVRAEYGPASENNAQFCIFTRDADWKISFAFGQVESGLKVVSSAVRHSNIKDVAVVDCGVVLPL